MEKARESLNQINLEGTWSRDTVNQHPEVMDGNGGQRFAVPAAMENLSFKQKHQGIALTLVNITSFTKLLQC